MSFPIFLEISVLDNSFSRPYWIFFLSSIILSDFSDIIEDGAKLIGLTWKIDTRIEPHPITTEDFKKVSNPFVKEVVDTGIKVAW